MKKTRVFLAGIILFIFLIYACEMPNSIEFKTEKFKINAPVKIANFNIATVLSEALKSSFPEGFEIYDMVNYKGAQAFLIAYQMDILESFHPDDYLENLKNPDEITPIDETITIPKLTANTMPGIPIPFDMQKFFADMKKTINDGISTPHSESTVTFPYISPPFMASYFDSITVDTGSIRLDIWLEDATSGDTVDLTSVSFGGCSNTSSIEQITSLNTEGNRCHVDIDIGGAVIDKNTPFILYGTSSSGAFTLVMEPRITDITLLSATALKTGQMTESMPPEIVDYIIMGPIPDLYDAKIMEGEFWLRSEATSLSENMIILSENMIINANIVIRQPVTTTISLSPSYPSFKSLGGKMFAFTDAVDTHSLTDEFISGEILDVDSASTITIKADPTDGSTFTLVEGKLLVEMDVGMKIETLNNVRWNKSILPPITLPPIDFSNMGDANVSFINWIEFSEFNLKIDFGDSGLPDALEKRIALKVDCPELGFEDTDPDQTKKLENGENIFYGKETPPYDKVRLTVHDENTNKVKEVPFDVKLIPVIIDTNGDEIIDEDSPYIEFGPVDMSGGENITMNIKAQVTVDFEWESAEIDLQTALDVTDSELAGTFPNEDTEDGVDLSEMGKYMHDVTFSKNLEAKIFFSGPEHIIKEIKPTLDFSAQWGDDESPDRMPMVSTEQLTVSGTLPELPGKHPRNGWVYTGTELPKKDEEFKLENFNEIIANFPQNLRFSYDMTLKNQAPIIVKRNDFNEEDDNKIRALMVLRLPLELEVAKDGYFAIPSDVFGGEEDENGDFIVADLFGRENPGDPSLFTGVNIKSLGIQVNFGSSIFAGSNFHFDEEGKLFGKNGLPLGDSSSLNITLTGEQQTAIEENLIYPNIKFVFPQKKTVRVARNFLPVRIVVSASGSYTLDIADIFGSD